MQEQFQVQITEGSHVFIMDSDSGASIVDRDRLGDVRENESVGSVDFEYDGRDWTAIRLARLLGVDGDDWAQAVFIEGKLGATTIFVAQQVRLIERSKSGSVKPFSMIGCAANVGPLFNGIWVSGAISRPVLDRERFISVVRDS